MSHSELELFKLNHDGSLPDMNSFLQDCMLWLFAYLAKNDPWVLTVDCSTWTDGDHLWPYVLLARDKCNFVPAMLNRHIYPTISDFHDNSGRKMCPDSERVVFIGEIFWCHKESSLTIPDYSHGCRDYQQDDWQVDADGLR